MQVRQLGYMLGAHEMMGLSYGTAGAKWSPPIPCLLGTGATMLVSNGGQLGKVVIGANYGGLGFL
jgi:hypothetical protein